MNPGHFITFEGPEGCGKSTQIKYIEECLQKKGLDVLLLREPGGTAIGESIRHLLQHDKDADNMCPETELLLFAASRAQLVREIINPALQAGKIVLCDRFLDSTTVYQGIARNISTATVSAINAFAVGSTLPDTTILIDLEPEESQRRIQSRAPGEQDRIERESLTFHTAVRDGYLSLSKTEPKRFFVINGHQSIETIGKAIWNHLSERFTK